MILIEEELSLIEAAKEYIYAFLSEFGEFLPFALVMQGGDIIPLEHEENDQSLTLTHLIYMYENYFNKERKDDREYQLGILCVDIFIRSKKEKSKRKGIEYRLFGINYTKRVVQYYEILKDKTVLFNEMVGWDSEEDLYGNAPNRELSQ